LKEDVYILAIGSHEERHGAALPPDTDARLASHVAQEAARRTGAKFLGVLRSSFEHPEIETGNHQSLGEVMAELRAVLTDAKRRLNARKFVMVNGHGGNDVLKGHLQELEAELGIRLVFNNKLIELEGPHAGTGEVSMAAAIGIADESKIKEHVDFDRYPEVGFVGLRLARRSYEWAEREAQEVERYGVRIDKHLGLRLLEFAVADVMNDVNEMP
jgi:2-amino-5-formylamino-6-ribosylaminopyrimidin-4(3H)-one 5'-monophosphate deformylase